MVRHEGGAAAITAVVIAAATTAVGLLGVATAGDLALAAVRAQAAADAAALAAAAASPLGPAPDDPRAAALATAGRHGVVLADCCGASGALPPLIRVTVSARPRTRFAQFIQPQLRARASASLRPATSREPLRR